MNGTINESKPNDPQSIFFPLANHKGFLGKGAVCLKAKQDAHGLPLLPAKSFFINNVRLAWLALTHHSFPISKQFYWEPDPELDQNNSGTSANLSCLLALAFTYSSRWPLKNFQVWATGEVDNTGELNPINLLSHKLKGILSSNASTRPKLVFAPLANFDDIQALRQSESFEELVFNKHLSITHLEKIMSLAHGTQAVVIWLAPNDLKLLLKWLNVHIGSDFSRKGILGLILVFWLLATVVYSSVSVFNPNTLTLNKLYYSYNAAQPGKVSVEIEGSIKNSSDTSLEMTYLYLENEVLTKFKEGIVYVKPHVYTSQSANPIKWNIKYIDYNEIAGKWRLCAEFRDHPLLCSDDYIEFSQDKSKDPIQEVRPLPLSGKILHNTDQFLLIANKTRLSVLNAALEIEFEKNFTGIIADVDIANNMVYVITQSPNQLHYFNLQDQLIFFADIPRLNERSNTPFKLSLLKDFVYITVADDILRYDVKGFEWSSVCPNCLERFEDWDIETIGQNLWAVPTETISSSLYMIDPIQKELIKKESHNYDLVSCARTLAKADNDHAYIINCENELIKVNALAKAQDSFQVKLGQSRFTRNRSPDVRELQLIHQYDQNLIVAQTWKHNNQAHTPSAQLNLVDVHNKKLTEVISFSSNLSIEAARMTPFGILVTLATYHPTQSDHETPVVKLESKLINLKAENSEYAY